MGIKIIEDYISSGESVWSYDYDLITDKDTFINVYLADPYIDWGYEQGDWLGEDTIYGGGWYGGGYFIENCEFDTIEVSGMDYYGNEISDEDFLRRNPELTLESLQELKDWCLNNTIEQTIDYLESQGPD